MKNITFALCLFLVSAGSFANELVSTSAPGTVAYFTDLKNEQTVDEKFTVRFGLSGMGIAPAGVNAKNTGHHHLLIDIDPSDIDFTTHLPATSNIKHFGGGQTEVDLTLPKGEHTLQLLLGNYVHIPHDEPVLSKKITITVK